jgi:hypothetical protein
MFFWLDCLGLPLGERKEKPGWISNAGSVLHRDTQVAHD